MHWMDRAYGLVRTRTPCFKDGWGDARAVAEGDVAAWLGTPAQLPAISWGPRCMGDGYRVRDGMFTSPVAELPAGARAAHVRLLEPLRERGAACVSFGAWADDGFEGRQRALAPLVRRGLTLLLLETPYHGCRRPLGRVRTAVNTVGELLLMGRAAVIEARCLLVWLRQRGYARVGVTGFSMGGQMAAMAAATAPFPTRVVTIVPSASPAPVFTEGLLSSSPRWRALGRRHTRPRQRLREVLSRMSVLALAPPVAPEHALIVGARHDGIVPGREAERIAAHWGGAELRWLPGGHVAAATLHAGAHRDAIVDAYGL